MQSLAPKFGLQRSGPSLKRGIASCSGLAEHCFHFFFASCGVQCTSDYFFISRRGGGLESSSSKGVDKVNVSGRQLYVYVEGGVLKYQSAGSSPRYVQMAALIVRLSLTIRSFVRGW